MRAVYRAIDRVSRVAVPVLIEGESGTGKDLVARVIHARSPRRDRPFVVVSCGALPDELLESELFGHRRGAFTGADRDREGLFRRADGGTLFLDEVAETSPAMQVKLLRALAEGEVLPLGGDVPERVDVRVLCATHRSLRDEVERGRFREDLFYRLSVVEIVLPPLRERPEDVPALCADMLERFAAIDGLGRRRLSDAALRALSRARFPGNVRELEHVLLNAAVMSEGSIIDVGDLQLDARQAPTSRNAAAVRAPARDGGSGVPPCRSEAEHKAAEREAILSALAASGWNRTAAARSLDMPRRTFYRRLETYGLLDRARAGGDQSAESPPPTSAAAGATGAAPPEGDVPGEAAVSARAEASPPNRDGSPGPA